MDIFQPNQFFQLSGLIVLVMTALVTLVGVFIASNMYGVAKEALGTWKKEKEFDIDIDGYARLIDALKLLEDLKQDRYDPDYVGSFLSEILTKIHGTGQEEVYRSCVNIFSYIKYYQEQKDRLFDLRKQALRVIRVSSDNKLIALYQFFTVLEASIFRVHHNYHYSIINKFIDAREFKGLSKESLQECGYYVSFKREHPNESDEEIYKKVYELFFRNTPNDPLLSFREDVVKSMINGGLI